MSFRGMGARGGIPFELPIHSVKTREGHAMDMERTSREYQEEKEIKKKRTLGRRGH